MTFALGWWLLQNENNLPFPAVAALWLAYWFFQGCFFTGLWVTAHECGHGGFSDSQLVNDIVGTIGHSFLLVPYESWKISHGQHHHYTGNEEHDEVFVPDRHSNWHGATASPINAMKSAVIALLFGWPAYLIANVSGPKKYKGKTNDHFTPSSVLFKESQYNGVVVTDIFLFSWIAVLIFAVAPALGFFPFIKLYFIPYLNNNFWLVLITFLQHTDVFLPHYAHSEWSYVRGALATVDRDFGWFLNNVFHHIHDTHVCHHIFSDLPFYNAQEATVALKKKLGDYYLFDPTPFPLAAYRGFYYCQFLDDKGGCLYFDYKK